MKKIEWAGVLMVCPLLLPLLGRGQELVTGYEGGPSNGYAFVSPIITVPRSDRNMFVIRPSAGYLYYNFRESGGFTNVTSPGAAIQIGYRLQTPRLTFTLGPGFEVRWDHRNLASGQTTRRTQTGPTGEAEAFFQATPRTNLNVISSYGAANHYLWTRVGIKRQITKTQARATAAVSIGPEVTGQGNHDVRQYQGGGMLELGFLRARASLQFRGGYAYLRFADGSTTSRPYFGIGLYHRF